jgi:hypothetical protein
MLSAKGTRPVAPEGSSLRPETTGKRPVTAAGSNAKSTRPTPNPGENPQSQGQAQSSRAGGKAADDARLLLHSVLLRLLVCFESLQLSGKVRVVRL